MGLGAEARMNFPSTMGNNWKWRLAKNYDKAALKNHIRKLTEISILGASLPFVAGVALVVISMVLTLIAGLLPSRIAAKKDPVEALRSE